MIAKRLDIRQIFATNSQKTIEVELETNKGKVQASVPIGTSRGKYEVIYLPVEQAINKFNLIKRSFISKDFKNQIDVDLFIREIDKSEDLHEIGGNVALAISSAFLKAFALEANLEVFEYISLQAKIKPQIPRPICNVAGGWKENKSDIQEFLLMPLDQKNFFSSIEKISSAYVELGKNLMAKDTSFNFGKNFESGWITSLTTEDFLKVLAKVAIKYLLRIGLDVAASQLWDGKQYYVYSRSTKQLSKMEQLSFITNLSKNFSISYIEDPFDEDDFESFSLLFHENYSKIICGDDLFATNLGRLQRGIEAKAVNATIVKPSQVGTISDVINFVKLAKKNGLTTVMSHRSGETEDTLIAHLAVGLGCDYVKFGISGERIPKINEMIRIEKMMM